MVKDNFRDGRLFINRTPDNLIPHDWLNAVGAAVNEVPQIKADVEDALSRSGTSGLPTRPTAIPGVLKIETVKKP